MIRTVLGDIRPDDLGFCHAHDHVLIGRGIGTDANADLLIDNVEKAVEEVNLFAAAGGGALVDAMPLDCGRDPTGLIEVSTRTGVHIVATTGFHTRHYYGPGHWSERLDIDVLAAILINEVNEGMDRHSHGGRFIDRLGARAGLVKIATDEQGMDDRAERHIQAAAACHAATGVPVLTHPANGRHAIQQLEALVTAGVPAGAVLLSHLDRDHDPAVHADLADTGAFLIYDGPSRTKYHQPDEVAALMLIAAAKGATDRLLIGLDLALRSYRVSYGGGPGLAFTLTTFLGVLAAAGFDQHQIENIGMHNPARALSLHVPPNGTGSPPVADVAAHRR